MENADFLPKEHRGGYFRAFDGEPEEGSAAESPAVVVEGDPVSYLGRAFRLILGGRSLVLGNPNWKEEEIRQVREQCGSLEGDEGLILVPTGGTTGSLRLAIHRWETFACAAEGLCAGTGGGAISSFCVLPLWHVSGWMQAVRAVVTGGTWTPGHWGPLRESGFRAGAPGGDGPTLSLVPTQLEQVLQSGGGGLAFLRCFRGIFVGGAPWKSKASQAYCREEGLPILLSYGMTETAAMVTLQPIEDFLAGKLTSGKALPHAEIRVKDPDAEGNGRIAVRSRALFSGYAGRPSRRSGDWFLTSDLGRLVAGRLEISGRIDRVILSGGENVDLEVVEGALRKLPGVVEALAYGERDPVWGDRLEAVIVPEPGISRSPEALGEELKAFLPAAFRPKRIRVLRKIPRNAAGKPDMGLFGGGGEAR